MRGGEERYGMHNLARRYAEERLARSGSAAVAEVQAAHGRFYCQKLREWEPDLMGELHWPLRSIIWASRCTAWGVWLRLRHVTRKALTWRRM